MEIIEILQTFSIIDNKFLVFKYQLLQHNRAINIEIGQVISNVQKIPDDKAFF